MGKVITLRKELLVTTPQPNGDVLINSFNFQSIQSICSRAKDKHMMIGLVGEPGYGKTIGLSHYQKKNDKVFMATAKPSMKSKTFWLEILKATTLREKGFSELDEYDSRSLYHILSRVSEALKNIGDCLLIIDEAGKLSDKMLSYLHEIRDDTKETCGIVLAGPGYFKRNLDRWDQMGKVGIPEIMRRINTWHYLRAPSHPEIKKICELSGIKDDAAVKALISRTRNFGQLRNEIVEIIDSK